MPLVTRLIATAIVACLSLMPARADDVVNAMGDAFVARLPSGWTPTIGGWGWFDFAGCNVPGGNCWGNNPSSPTATRRFRRRTAR